MTFSRSVSIAGWIVIAVAFAAGWAWVGWHFFVRTSR